MPGAQAGILLRLLKPGRRSRRRGRTACGIMVGLCAGLLLAGQGTRYAVGLDVLNQFQLQLALGLAAFAIGFAVPRARVLCAIVIALSGLIGIGLYPQLERAVKLSPVATPAQARPLKVMSFNMSLLNREPELVLAEVARISPDLVTLIEISPEQRELIDALRAIYPYAQDCTGRPGCYFIMFSRHAFSPLPLKSDWRTPPFMALRLGPEFGNLSVLGVHTLRFPHSRGQKIQTRALAAMLNRIPGNKLVMGDFNATGFSAVLKGFAAESGLERFTYLPSWPSTLRLPQLGIDHVFGSPGIEVLEPQHIGRYAGSDHYPVYVTLAIPVP